MRESGGCCLAYCRQKAYWCQLPGRGSFPGSSGRWTWRWWESNSVSVALPAPWRPPGILSREAPSSPPLYTLHFHLTLEIYIFTDSHSETFFCHVCVTLLTAFLGISFFFSGVSCPPGDGISPEEAWVVMIYCKAEWRTNITATCEQIAWARHGNHSQWSTSNKNASSRPTDTSGGCFLSFLSSHPSLFPFLLSCLPSSLPFFPSLPSFLFFLFFKETTSK